MSSPRGSNSTTPFGPFDPATLHELDAGPHPVTYAGRVVPHGGARWFVAGFGTDRLATHELLEAAGAVGAIPSHHTS